MPDAPVPTTPADPPKNLFARLDPAWRALIVFALSTAFSIGWQKFLPGVPVPPLPGTTVVNVLPQGTATTPTAAK